MRRTVTRTLAVAGLLLGSVGLWNLAAQGQDHMKMPPPPKQAVRIQKSIDNYKAQLAKQGKYACCVRPTCDMCATHMGGCPCGKMAAAGKPVCRECKGGWEAGEGAIGGKEASDIKAMPAGMK
jgi:hypothetical protein